MVFFTCALGRYSVLQKIHVRMGALLDFSRLVGAFLLAKFYLKSKKIQKKEKP
jgi:hypothetical protein